MSLMEVLDRLRHAPAHPHATVVLPDPEHPHEDDTPPGYFQVRLTDMALSDDRRWFQEIVPATFFLVDFNYGDNTMRQPFFVSNQLLSMMPAGVDPTKLRVRFKDTLVAGPTPYAGGDVGLFVGLFQSAIEDNRKVLFSVFETLFDGVGLGLGMLSQYARLADKLSEQIFRSLGSADIKCLLAERRVIGLHAPPPRGYLAFLYARQGDVDKGGLEVRDGTLQRRTGGTTAPLQDLDYCLVRIEHLDFRNDYGKMSFNPVLARAREARRNGRVQEAQTLLLECANQIDASADLSAKQKSALIESSAAALYATPDLTRPPGEQAATREGAPSSIWTIQKNAQQALGFRYDGALLSPSFQRIADLAVGLSQTPHVEGPLTQSEIVAHLKQASQGPALPSSKLLVQALTAGSVIG
jgi:hypothetical protein